jgi:hypothetical protein
MKIAATTLAPYSSGPSEKAVSYYPRAASRSRKTHTQRRTLAMYRRYSPPNEACNLCSSGTTKRTVTCHINKGITSQGAALPNAIAMPISIPCFATYSKICTVFNLA